MWQNLDKIFVDKMCDQVSDAILDAHLKQDPDAKVGYHTHLALTILALIILA